VTGRSAARVRIADQFAQPQRNARPIVPVPA